MVAGVEGDVPVAVAAAEEVASGGATVSVKIPSSPSSSGVEVVVGAGIEVKAALLLKAALLVIDAPSEHEVVLSAPSPSPSPEP